MKILHVCSNYYPAHGGPQYTMKHVSEKLIQFYKDEVEVATSNSLYGPEMSIFKKINPSVEIINGVKIYRLPFSRWHYSLLTFANKISGKLRKKSLPYSILKLRRGLDSKKINTIMKFTDADVIMASTADYIFCDYPTWRFKTKNPKPFVLYGSIHFHFKHSLNSPLIKRAKACDCYIANTNFEKQCLVNYGVDENKIVTAGTGINISDFMCNEKDVYNWRHSYGIKNDELLIAHIGRLSKGKGVEEILKTYKSLHVENKKIKLLLAGTTTEYVTEIKDFIKDENLSIILLEDFNNELKPLLLHAMDIFALASQGESFGVVFLEAWACKKPVIGANTGAIASLIDNNIDGILFEPNNAKSLYHSIKMLVDNKNLRIYLGQNGYKKIVQNYSWQIIVSKYREAYQLGIKNFKSKCSAYIK